jgi:ATP:ADP antiporter, AAA family
MKNLKQFFSTLDVDFKKNLFFILASYFLALFTYPLIRSATTTYFLASYGAKSTPKAWLIAVCALTVVIWMANRIQSKIGLQKLYLGICIFSSFIFLGAMLGHFYGIQLLSYVLYVWKEIYIVLLIHLVLAYSNTLFNLEQMKRLYGYIGASGSVGGVLGGLLTSYLSNSYGVSTVVYVAIAAIFCNGFVFYRTRPIKIKLTEKSDMTPLSSIKDIKLYVFLVASVVALSQFCINIADLQFNLLFEKAVSGAVQRTAYQGKLYSLINLVSFFFQIVIIPFFFVRVSNKKIQYAIPLFYLFLSVVGLGFGGGLLFSVAGTFILFKATDYSIFSVSKEILYHALTPIQKFGTKYITDMVVYRAAKATIAVILIFVQDLTTLRVMLVSFLLLWFVLLAVLFKKQSSLVEE